jgi:AAHS family 3-hydroxyphenylpropionic acid transporter
MTEIARPGITGGRLTIILCFIVALLEGFDIQAAGVAAPRLAASLGFSPNDLGLFFSASTVGMLFGAFVGGRTSDRYGRKPILLVSVAIFGLCSILTGLAQSIPFLVTARFLTGLGLGGALPALIALAAENNPQRRGRAVALMFAGTPLGGAIAGTASALVPNWQMIFHIGGLSPLLVLPMLIVFLKETRHVDRRSPGTQRSPIFALFGDHRAAQTLTLWLAFFSGMLVLYLMLNWTPTLLASRGFPKSQIALFQTVLNVVGAISVMAASPLIDGKRIIPLAIAAYGCTAIALALVAHMSPAFWPVLAVACLFGGALLTSQSLLYATAPRIYPEDIRGTGVGGAVGFGRAGSVTGPMLAALILSTGVGPAQLILLTIPIVLIGGIANIIVLLLHRKRGGPA